MLLITSLCPVKLFLRLLLPLRLLLAAPATTEAAPATTEAAPATTEAAPATTEAAPAPATTEAAPAEAAPATTDVSVPVPEQPKKLVGRLVFP